MISRDNISIYPFLITALVEYYEITAAAVPTEHGTSRLLATTNCYRDLLPSGVSITNHLHHSPIRSQTKRIMYGRQNVKAVEFYCFPVHANASFPQETFRKVTWAVKLIGNSQLLCLAEQSLTLAKHFSLCLHPSTQLWRHPITKINQLHESGSTYSGDVNLHGDAA